MTTRGLQFTPVRPEDIPAPGKVGRPSKYTATIGEFLRSGALAVEVDPGLASPTGATCCLRKVIKREGLEGQLVAFTRDKRVFLLRAGT